MAKTATRVAAEPVDTELQTAEILELDDVAARRERAQAYAQATSLVAVYWFAIPEGSTVPSLADPDLQRDAGDQLHLVAAMVGGSLGKTPGGVVVRTPLSSHARFEGLARPILDAWLVAFQRETC